MIINKKKNEERRNENERKSWKFCTKFHWSTDKPRKISGIFEIHAIKAFIALENHLVCGLWFVYCIA